MRYLFLAAGVAGSIWVMNSLVEAIYGPINAALVQANEQMLQR